MKKLLGIVFLGLLLSGNVYAKDLKCELGIHLLKPKSSAQVIVDFSYDEEAYKSFEPIAVKIGKIDFINISAVNFKAKRAQIFNELLNVNQEVIQGEKTILNRYYTFDFAVKEKMLVYTTLNTKDVKDVEITMYECT